MILPLAAQALLQAFRSTHQFTQTRTFYHYRGPDLRLSNTMSVRKALSPEGQALEKAEGRQLVDTLFLKLYELAYQAGYQACNQDLSPLRKIQEDILQSQLTTEYLR